MDTNSIVEWTLTTGKAVGLQAYEIIRDQIIRGTLKPGTRISEAEISQNLQISRQPVREAFLKLQSEGLVEIRPQRGTLVTPISIEAVGDARFIREAVEADIVKLLVERCNAESIATLRAQIRLQRNVEETHLEEFISLDDQFHKTLALLAGKGNTWRITAGMKIHFDRVRYLSSTQKNVQSLVDQHEAVVNAVERRDTGRAELAVRTHLREVLQDLPAMVARQPELFADDGKGA